MRTGLRSEACRTALVALVAAGAVLATRPAAATPCADGVASFVAGTNGGYQADLLPGIAIGPPFGAGMTSGSVDVVSLGNGGSITLSSNDSVIEPPLTRDTTSTEPEVMPAPNGGPIAMPGSRSA